MRGSEMIFTHTSKERDLWRGWFKSGQAIELSRSRQGWDFGAGILIHANDTDRGDRMLCVKFWRYSAYIPLGITFYGVDINDEPQWSVFGSAEYGLWVRWSHRSRRFDWPGSVFTSTYEQQLPDGSWVSVFDQAAVPYSETHPYTYILKSGEVQSRNATISKRRHILARHWLHRIGWPTWSKESVNIKFDGEVGERAGSWKGGTIGCAYDLCPGETMLDSLRRMEREREF